MEPIPLNNTGTTKTLNNEQTISINTNLWSPHSLPNINSTQ